MASLIIEHGVMPRYQAKKVTNYRYTEQGDSQTVNYVYSVNPQIIGSENLYDLTPLTGDLYGFYDEFAINLFASSFYPYLPHNETYVSNCVPYYEDGVQTAWQITEDSEYTTIRVYDHWPWFIKAFTEPDMFDPVMHPEEAFNYCIGVRGIKWEIIDALNQGSILDATVLNSPIQYVGRDLMNHAIVYPNGDPYTQWPSDDNYEYKNTTRWSVKGAMPRLTSENQNIYPNPESIEATGEFAWKLNGISGWDVTASEATILDTPTKTLSLVGTPMYVSPIIGSKNIYLYNLRLTEEIEP